MNISSFPSNSRVWVYQSNRVLTLDEQTQIQVELNTFIAQWAAHGSALKAGAQIQYDSLIILAVDESLEAASGCSIDSSVHFVKSLGQKYNFDAFNRNTVAYLKDTSVGFTTLQDLSKVKDAKVFNLSVSNVEQLKNKLLVNFEKSALSRVNIDASFTFSL
jgi:hypothetical protein